MNTHDDQTWFEEQIAAYLADGLRGDERSRFEAHAASCPRCAAELERATRDEARLAELFADATPPAGFEHRIITRLRTTAPARRLRLHPWLAKAAATAAAVAIVGGAGYVATQQLRPNPVSTREQIGQAILMYSNDAKGSLPMAPSANAEKWDFAGGSKTPLDWSKFNGTQGVQRELSYSYAKPYSAPDALAAGELVDQLLGGLRAGKAGDSNNHDEDGQNVLYGDRHVEFQSNPFVGVQRDSISAGQQAAKATAAGPPLDHYDSVVLPTDVERWITHSFKPGALATAGKEDPKGQQQMQQLLGEMKPLQQQTKQVQLQPQSPPPPATTGAVFQRKVIRNGQIEFEVDSFDSALSSITKIASEEGGFIATTNSEKLDNGKVKGTVVVRVPPDRLDTLVLKLRALGDLKRQNLTAQDVTKQYTDLESELRAARAMEERLIDIIKTGKGEIKDLLAAEKELANWRGKLEKIQGEINFFNNQIALSTLSIDLIERNISNAAAASEQEDVNMGVEADDVEAARAAAIAAVDEAKGRIVEAEMKQLDAGQLAAKVVAEVPPENAGPVIDRLKQLGKVARMDVQRKQTTPSGAAPSPSARVERKDTRLIVSIYNLANVAPRETTNLNLACADVEAAYKQVLARVEKAGGRVISSSLNRQKADQISGSIQFETKSAEGGPVLLDVRAMGEVMRLAVTENPDTANVTTAKHGFVVQLVSASQVAPRETVTVQLAAGDVPQSHQALVEAAKGAGRVLSSQVNEGDRLNVTGTLDLEIAREHHAAFEKALGAAGDVLTRNVTRAADAENTIDGKLRVQVSLIGADRVAARETTTMGVETRDVDAAVTRVAALATAAGGRVVDSTLAREGDGRSAARVILDVPLAKSAGVIDQIKRLGELRTERATKNAQVPDGPLARARVELTLATPQAIVSGDQGFWSSIRKGLGTSAAGLMWSLQILVVGLCFVVPWALVLWGGWKLVQRARRVADA